MAKLNPKKWMKVRRYVLYRDGYKCQMCGKRSRHNHIHHILPKRNHPKLMYKCSNLITLCPTCHKKTYGKEYNYTRYLQNKIKSKSRCSHHSTNRNKTYRKPKKVIRRTGRITVKIKKYKKKTYKVKVKR